MTDTDALIAKLLYEECDDECKQPCPIHRATRKAAADLIEQQAAEIERLSAALAEAQKDAERYRWLRRPTTLGVGMVMIWQRGKGRYDYATGDDLDAAIDAARGGA